MLVKENGYLLMFSVQQRLYEGLQPDENGDYVIGRKEFIERLPMAPVTFNSYIKKFVEYYISEWDPYTWFGLVDLAGENLYADVRYEKGKLRFKRNAYTLRPESAYVWARRPYGWVKRSLFFSKRPGSEECYSPDKKGIDNYWKRLC